MALRIFHDLPVYRVPSDQYYRERDAYVDRMLFPSGITQESQMRALSMSDPDSLAAWKASIERAYGGCWDFNEIVGFIRLHLLGTQVRGEYFSTAKKRVVRSRAKTFQFVTWKLVPEGFIDRPYGSDEILSAVRDYIEVCKAALPRRYVDTAAFDLLAPHINWEGLLRESNA